MLNPVFENFETFLFVFIRVSAILIFLPFFGSKSIPGKVKAGLSLLLAIMIAPLLNTTVPMPETIEGLTIAIIREALIGFSIGFAVKLVFGAIEMAGQVAGIQMGYGVANVLDPNTGGQLSVLSQFYNILGILLLFSLNIHLVFIAAIRKSFDVIPPYNFHITSSVLDGLLQMAGNMFEIAVRLAAPLMIAILLTNIAMGVMARTVPQLNVFVIGFPITITLGILVLLFVMPFVISVLNGAYEELAHNLMELLKAGGGM